MKVAVTGGTGCLGQALMRRLEGRGFDIRLLVMPQDKQKSQFTDKIEAISGDINSPEALLNLTKDAEIVFHLAGKVHLLQRSRADEKEFYRVNTEGTRLLIEAAAKNKARRIIFFSTVGVYGEAADFHGDEKSPCNPLTVYSKSKYNAEKIVLNSHKSGGPDGVVLRFPVAYGAYDRGNVAKLIKAIYYRYFFLIGDGSNVRSMISSTNAAAAAVLVALEPKAANEVFCVSDNRDHALLELIVSICTALRRKSRLPRIPHAVAEFAGKVGDFVEKSLNISLPVNSNQIKKLTKGLTISSNKAKNILGYEPKETLDEGILREVRWLNLAK